MAPVIAEDNIKAELPCVSNAVLIGDKKKYLSVFLTLKTVVKDDLPTDKLAPDAVLWCQVCSLVQFYELVLGANLRALIRVTVLLLSHLGLIQNRRTSLPELQRNNVTTLVVTCLCSVVKRKRDMIALVNKSALFPVGWVFGHKGVRHSQRSGRQGHVSCPGRHRQGQQEGHLKSCLCPEVDHITHRR